MPSSNFTKLIQSFDEDALRRGKQFEKAVKYLLQNDPKYKRKYKHVWLWDEFPERTGPDIGIDLVAQGHDNSLCAIQAKCFDPGRQIPKSEIDSFISAASPRKYAHRMLVATTDGLSVNARKTLRDNQVTLVLKSSLESLESFWPETFSSLGATRTISKYVPRTHQAQAINDVSAGLQTASRGQLIMACGTGKTLTALWITEHLDSSCTLVLVPSLSLLSQTLSEWTTHANKDWDYICVCSDETVNKSDDSIVTSVNEIPAVTTKPADIAKFLKTRGRKIVFSTYQSSAQVAKAQKLVGKKFDLTIADEAHRLTGKNDAEFATVLDAKKIPTKKLLFMTATPRTYTASIKQTALDRGVEISSMDDEKVFGKELHKLSFGQAIEQDLLTDYRVVIVGVTDPQVQELIERRELVSVGGKVETDARTLAAHIGLAKAVKDYDLKKTISFHGRIKTAQAFAQDFPKIVEWMPDDHKPSGTFWADTINGAMNSSERRILLEKLKADIPNQHSLLSNARCLTEGIDVPALDAVAFIDPRSSQVDIIQAVGRAIRRSTNKTLGTIVLPVLIPSDVDAETAVEDSAFKPIWAIVNALRAHDENLANELDELRTSLGRTKTVKPILPPKLVIDLPIDIDILQVNFTSKLNLKIIENSTRSWSFWFGLLQTFVKEKGHCEVKDKEIFNERILGTWVTKQRMAYTRNSLSRPFVEQLNSIPGWSWAPLKDDWLGMYEAFVDYQSEKESLNIPDTIRGPNGSLSTWTERQRARYRRSPKAFEKDKLQKLEAIPGWSWDPLEEAWNNMHAALIEYQKTNDSLNIPSNSQGPNGKLRTWITGQRTAYHSKKKKLDKSKIQKLEAIPGWSWDPLEEAWNNMHAALIKYQRENKSMKIPDSLQGPNGSLATWTEKQRAKYRRSPKKFEKDKRQKLEAIPGWSWDIREDIWIEMYTALVKYQRTNTSLKIPRNFQGPTGSLATWMEKQRARYRRSPKSFEKTKIQMLEAIPGWTWHSK
jgi:superfamily II DNA or RNA helicase